MLTNNQFLLKFLAVEKVEKSYIMERTKTVYK